MDKLIRELARKNVIVNRGLHAYDMGSASAQESLIQMVCALVEHNDQLIDKCKEIAMATPMTVLVKSLDQIVGLKVDDEIK